MLTESEARERAALAGAGGPGSQAAQDAIDKQIEENMRDRELAKMREAFYSNLKEYYQARKAKEFITMHCSNFCLNNRPGETSYAEDKLNRMEKHCLMSCYHKTYHYLIQANTVYSYLTTDPAVMKQYLD